MEQTNSVDEVVIKPEGKGLAVSGFVISLAAILLFGGIAYVAAMQAVQAAMLSIMGTPSDGGYLISFIWLGVSIIGLVLSAIGMSKLKKSGAKRGLAVAGLIISIVTVLLCLVLLVGIKLFQDESKKKIDETTAAIENFDMEKFTSEMNAAMDSLAMEMDTTTAH